MNIPLQRLLAVVAGIIAVALGLVVAIAAPADSLKLLAWMGVSAGAGVILLVI